MPRYNVLPHLPRYDPHYDQAISLKLDHLLSFQTSSEIPLPLVEPAYLILRAKRPSQTGVAIAVSPHQIADRSVFLTLAQVSSHSVRQKERFYATMCNPGGTRGQASRQLLAATIQLCVYQQLASPLSLKKRAHES